MVLAYVTYHQYKARRMPAQRLNCVGVHQLGVIKNGNVGRGRRLELQADPA
jgi:hypothetical protein